MLFREAEPLPAPTIDEVLAAIDFAFGILAAQPVLAKRTAFTTGHSFTTGHVPCLCIVAAITAACPTKRIRDAVIMATQQALPSKYTLYDQRWRPIWQSSIADYNDQPATTLDDAKALLIRAKTFVGQVAA